MTITQLKQEVLGIIQDSTETTFEITENTHLIRDLGLSSMEAMMVVTDLEDRFGIRIAASKLRQVQTVADLTGLVIEALRA